MKKQLLLLLLLSSTLGAFAQDQLIKLGNSKLPNETVLVNQRNSEITIRFDLNEIELLEVNTDYGKAFIANSNKAPLRLEEGSPEIFYLTSTFIIPDTGDSELEISYGEFKDFENIEIAPSKGNLSRSIDPKTVPFRKGQIYNDNNFYPGTLAELRETFIMRDVRGQSVDVFPVQYNPVTKVLRVYTEITVTVKNTSRAGVNEFTTQKRHTAIEPQFNEIYKDLFINYSEVQGSRAFPLGEEGELLIICHPAFMADMQPYVDWKRTIGRKTTMVSTAVTGASTLSVKNYIANYYSNSANNLAYVLLVGDEPQIPTPIIPNSYSPYTGGSDNNYGYITGGDRYFEVFIGRMSAESVTHVQTQVQRTIHYERNLTTADTWLSNAIGLAANEGAGGGHDSGEADYVHMNNIRTKLMSYGYTTVYQEYTSGCGVTATSVASISSRFNSGVSMANYCNHGNITGWTLNPSPTYSNTNVTALTNAGKLPYIFSVACLVGRFHDGNTCFAEAWMRANQSGQPTGAVAVMMSTVSQNWLPPMTGQDVMVNICLDLNSYTGTQPGIKRTFAGVALNGSMKMIAIHGNSGHEDHDCWTVFGDPTLMIRTKTPQAMTVSYASTISLGANAFTVNCNTNGALVAVSCKNSSNEVVILGTAITTGGVANLNFSETLNSLGTITVAVTARDKVSHLGEVTVVSMGLRCEKPVNLSVTSDKNTAVISWSDSNDMEGTLQGYNIYRNGTKINTNLITVQEYHDQNLTNGTYTYQVRAVYQHCESALTNGVPVVIEVYAVNYNTPANGTLSVNAGTTTIVSGSLVNAGTVLTISATPNQYYLLESLVVNGNNFTNGNSSTVTKATTISCSFRAVDPTITYMKVNDKIIATPISTNITPLMAVCGENQVVLQLTSEGEMKVNGVAYTPNMPVPFTNDKAVINIESKGTYTKNYSLTVTKALGSAAPIYIQRWGKTLAVVNNRDRNGGHNFDEYRWFLNGSSIPGSNTGYILLNGRQANEYAAEVHSINSGEWHKLCHQVINPQSQTAITVYPNPVDAGGLLTLSLPENVNIVTVSIYDLNGNLVRQQKAVQNTVSMPNQTGLYIVEIQLPDGSNEVQQVIVK